MYRIAKERDITPIEMLLIKDQEERKKQQKVQKPNLIYDDNFYKKIWDYYIMVLILGIAIKLPYAFAVTTESQDTTGGIQWFGIGALLEVSFVLDMIATFFTTYYDEKQCRTIEDHR